MEQIGYLVVEGYILIINIAAFLTYGCDKYFARHQKWRIPERTLLTLAAVGGSAGAYLGMRLFHHKTRKKKFSVGVPLLFALQVLIVCLCR